MKFIFTILITLFSSSIVTAQTKINLDEINNHIGDSVTICGLVADMRYFENSKGKPTFLNIGDRYPKQKITIVIWGKTREEFTEKPEQVLKKQICVSGRIILYKEKPEIVIERPEQLTTE